MDEHVRPKYSGSRTIRVNFFSTLLHDMLISRISRFEKKLRKLSDAKIKCRENNMTRKLSDSLYVDNLKSDFITL